MNNRVRALRAERAWSQSDLAAQLGVSRQTVNAIETSMHFFGPNRSRATPSGNCVAANTRK